MKSRFFFLLLIVLPSVVAAQTTVTYQNNSLHICDSNTFREILYSDPGHAGAGQIWDFSRVQDAGKNIISSVQCAEVPKMNGVNDYGMMLDENGYEYFMSSSEKDLVEQGYVNKDLKMVLSYSDPVVKMKYPFVYGDHFTDHFKGVALFDQVSSINLEGDITVEADGYGTLILPDRVIEGALRVKSNKTGLEVNNCGTIDVNITKYSWYAPGYRYPVLNLSSVESRVNGGAPTVTKSANTNIQQFVVKSSVLGVDILAQSKSSSVAPADQEIAVKISPNPFSEKLEYAYSLPGNRIVTIEMYDGSGKVIGTLVSNEGQTGGYHNGELYSSRYSLKSGVYFMRFTFDKQIVINKVVKF